MQVQQLTYVFISLYMYSVFLTFSWPSEKDVDIFGVGKYMYQTRKVKVTRSSGVLD